MTIELYVFPPSPRAFKVMAVANHLGLDWTLRFIDPTKDDLKTPQYAALNPNMRMPTLKDGDYVLWESNAIGQYLASKRPESGLMPKDERGRLDVTRWQFWDLAHWDSACETLVFEYFVKPFIIKAGEPDLAVVAKDTELFHRAAKVLDGQLRNRKFVTGDTLTLADFSLGAALNYAEMGHYPLEPYSEIKRWYGALSAIPAWQKTLTQAPLLGSAAA
ncbi:MAG: glutathione S-transferase family protein [Methylocella sp.]